MQVSNAAGICCSSSEDELLSYFICNAPETADVAGTPKMFFTSICHRSRMLHSSSVTTRTTIKTRLRRQLGRRVSRSGQGSEGAWLHNGWSSRSKSMGLAAGTRRARASNLDISWGKRKTNCPKSPTCIAVSHINLHALACHWNARCSPCDIPHHCKGNAWAEHGITRTCKCTLPSPPDIA